MGGEEQAYFALGAEPDYSTADGKITEQIADGLTGGEIKLSDVLARWLDDSSIKFNEKMKQNEVKKANEIKPETGPTRAAH